MIMNLPCGPWDSIQLIGFILFVLLALQSLLGIGLGIGFLLQPPLYRTILDLNTAFSRQAYFSIYARMFFSPSNLMITIEGCIFLFSSYSSHYW